MPCSKLIPPSRDDCQYKEAFCVMLYRCKNGHDEFIWNSRDGVTPFTVNCPVCKASSQHVKWKDDLYKPDLELPAPGIARVFAGITKPKAIEYAAKRVKSFDGSRDELKGAERKAMEVRLANDFIGGVDVVPWSDVWVTREDFPS